MAQGDKVNLIKGKFPTDYHCECDFCKKRIGELSPGDGTHYSRLERRGYYDKLEQGKGGHVAKTPLHIARWAVQTYSKPGGWVLDPTIGAGTTAVEAVTQGRNVAGMEVQFSEILQANVQKNLPAKGVKALIRIGDAREIGSFLKSRDLKKVQFDLIVNNPPYSGDEHMSTLKQDGAKETKHQSQTFKYASDLPNLAFLKEGQEYWDTMASIYKASVESLAPGGHFVIGVKDMMRKKAPYLLHKFFCELMVGPVGMKFVGTAVLRHWPKTQFLNTYEKMYGVRPPMFQTISVFQKKGK